MTEPLWHCDATGIWWLKLHDSILAEAWQSGEVWRARISYGGQRRNIHDDTLVGIKKYTEQVVEELLS